MAIFAFRIRYINEDAAYRHFHGFLDGIDWVLNCGRKRHGRDHVVIVRDVTPELRDRFVEWCSGCADVVAVLPITEVEFWSAPSHSI